MLKCPGKTFLRQKAILAARSPFFDSIFKENKNSIKIEKGSKLEEVDFTVATMECVLEFLYSGSLRREVVDAVELVRAGVYFQVVFFQIKPSQDIMLQVAGIINQGFRALSNLIRS